MSLTAFSHLQLSRRQVLFGMAVLPGLLPAASKAKDKVDIALDRGARHIVNSQEADGTFSDPNSRRTTYKTAQSDSELFPIYETNSAKLTVIGGVSEPKNPRPGDIVTVTAKKDEGLRKKGFLFWATDPLIEIKQPYSRSVKFCMPSTDLKVIAKPHL